MAAYTFSLSRAHAVADRLRKAAEAKRDDALATLAGKVFSHAPTDEQLAALKARGERALEMLVQAREGVRAVGHIREKLAQANATAGVSQMLAQIEAKKHEARLLEMVSGIDLLAMVPLDQVGATFKAQASEGAAAGYRPNVKATLVPITALDVAREERAVLQASINALSDQVNDLNKKTITVDLPDALAKEAGL